MVIKLSCEQDLKECKAYPMAGCIQCSQVPQPTCNWKWHSWQLGNLTTSKGFKAWDQECEAYPVAGCIQCWPTPIWYLPRSLDEMEVHENNFNFLPLFIELKVLSPQQFHLWLQRVTQEENNCKQGPKAVPKALCMQVGEFTFHCLSF